MYLCRICIGQHVLGGVRACLVILYLFAIPTVAFANDYTDELEQCATLEDDHPDDAIKLATDLLSRIDSQLTPIQYGRALGCMGWSLAINSQIDDARQYASILESLATKLPPSQDSINLLRRAGSIFHRVGDRISATENYSAAMIRASETKLISEQIPLLVNLGVLNSEIREHKRAIDNYYLALSLMKEIGDNRYQAPVLYNLAVTLLGQSRFEEALDAFTQTEALINEHWPSIRVASVYMGLADTIVSLKQYEKASGYIEQAKTLFEPLELSNTKIRAIVTYALVLNHLGEPEQALMYANQAREYFAALDLSFNDSNSLTVLAGIYESQELYSQALDILKIARKSDKEFQDSFNRETMAAMEARLQDSQQREELSELKSQNTLNKIRLSQGKKQRLFWLIAGGIFVFALSVFLFWQSRMNRRLKQISLMDSLTRLGNRRAISNWHQQTAFPKRPDCRLLWLIDIDHFKQVNDLYGHETGDQALRLIADCLTKKTDAQQFVGRWGGEEFMLLTDNIQADCLNAFALELLSQISRVKIPTENQTIQITASVGVSQLVDNSKHSWNQAISGADKALYQAKSQGRNQVISALDDTKINASER